MDDDKFTFMTPINVQRVPYVINLHTSFYIHIFLLFVSYLMRKAHERVKNVRLTQVYTPIELEINKPANSIPIPSFIMLFLIDDTR